MMKLSSLIGTITLLLGFSVQADDSHGHLAGDTASGQLLWIIPAIIALVLAARVYLKALSKAYQINQATTNKYQG